MYEKILARNIHNAYNTYIKDRDRYCFILQQVLQESVFRSSDQVIQGYSAGEIQREANDNRISEIRGSTELLSVV